MIRLPRPISVNHLHANVSGKGRVDTKAYRTWKWWATAMLSDQKPLPKFAGPVNLRFILGEVGVSSQMDTDNTLKALTDTLVTHGVITDDNRRVVRSISLEWQAGLDGCVAIVTEAA